MDKWLILQLLAFVGFVSSANTINLEDIVIELEEGVPQSFKIPGPQGSWGSDGQQSQVIIVEAPDSRHQVNVVCNDGFEVPLTCFQGNMVILDGSIPGFYCSSEGGAKSKISIQVISRPNSDNTQISCTARLV